LFLKVGGNCFKIEENGKEEIKEDVTIRKGNKKKKKPFLKRNWRNIFWGKCSRFIISTP
jgi:hypothetical protein